MGLARLVGKQQAAPPVTGESISVLFTEHEVNSAIGRMVSAVASSKGNTPLRLVVVLDGGRWLGDRIASALAAASLDTEQAHVRVTRSTGSALRGPPLIDPDFMQKALPALTGTDILLVDDICDEGRTLRALGELLVPIAARLRSAVLVRRIRPAGETAYVPTWAALETRHEGWLVGCGMDSGGSYRNLPYVGVIEREDSGA
jgi:hypoxanthine phosphoribosyltransferase